MPPDSGSGRPRQETASQSTRVGGEHGQRTRPDGEVVNAAAAFSCTRRGCTCTPDVVVTGVTVAGIRHVHVAHDDGCAALAGDTR